MFGVVRLIRSLRGPAAQEAAGRVGSSGSVEDPPVAVGQLRTLTAGIGTTLDEATTCAEPTRVVVARLSCSAAVIRGDGANVTGHEAIAGDADALPDARWAAAGAWDTVAPSVDGGGGQGAAHPAVGRSRPAFHVPLTPLVVAVHRAR
ncbi:MULTISPECIES: hypothetical protein [unclassified Streptomyces]|uniref:hypothetical protein n=1 Tax=unclassified Streptomyces TaxID=2593676 RepID=UPI002256895B|nr:MULTISPECIES: hypothetical protein [unclassified Streptomyces]MCX5053921.1 hypothetical protein [Streptomyces sp. NBC_00474]